MSTKFYNHLISLDIENSSICNAACPQCVRENTPGDYSWFEQTFLSTDFFENRIPDEVYNGIADIQFSGTLGDPCTAPNFIEVCKTIRKKRPDVMIRVCTNGGMKTEAFWTELATVLGENSKVTFGIDGLEDTNHIYRVNVRWASVMKNASAFINAGGNAVWQYIIFNHNQHQVEQAKTLAKEMGFKHFLEKPSHRFFLDDVAGITRYGSNGVIIQPPVKENYKHKIKTSFKNLDVVAWLKTSEQSKIECAVKKMGSLYIDHKGRLFPCCYLAGGLSARRTLPNVPDGWDKLWEEHGHKISLYENSWDEILDSEFFMTIQDSWSKPYPDRLATCAGTCSSFNGRFNDALAFNDLVNKEL